jgi:hypothetical protein
MKSSIATDGRPGETRHINPGGPQSIGLGIMRRITPLESIVYIGWKTSHGGFEVVYKLHSSGVGLMSSESPFKMEHHYGWTWMLSRNIDDHKLMRHTQCRRR